MLSENPHLSDQELLLAADGETQPANFLRESRRVESVATGAEKKKASGGHGHRAYNPRAYGVHLGIP